LITKGLSKVNNLFFVTIDGDFIIHQDLYKKLLSNKISGIDFVKVIDKRKNVLPYFHFNTYLELQRFSDNSQGIKISLEQCKDFKKNGYSGVLITNENIGIEPKIVEIKLFYENITSILLNKSDIFCTWEHFGLSNLKDEGKYIIRYARPLIIVSEKIKSIFEIEKVKNAEFSKIEFVD
jgi:hypothetical protein